MTDSYVIKIDGGHAKLYKSNGSYQRTIGDSGAKNAVISGDEVHVTMNNGKVKIYGVNGSYKRTI